jgi:sugar lactone lactonase YvrE
VAADGRLAIADTGHRRLVVMRPGRDGLTASVVPFAGELSEPVGVAWIGDDRLLVCDTGGRRVVVIAVDDGRLVDEVPLPEAWPDFYSRPQVAVLDDDLWVATDPPQRALWMVRSGVAARLDVGDNLAPAGVAFRDRTLWVTDLGGAVWAFELAGTGP